MTNTVNLATEGSNFLHMKGNPGTWNSIYKAAFTVDLNLARAQNNYGSFKSTPTDIDHLAHFHYRW